MVTKRNDISASRVDTPKGQACEITPGGGVAKWLRYKADLFGPRFCSGDDPFDFARKSVQHSKDFLAANDLKIAESYKKGDAKIVVHLTSCGGGGDSDLVFHRVPSGISQPSLVCLLGFPMAPR